MIQSLRDVLNDQSYGYINADERKRDVEPSDGRVIGLLRQVASSAQSLLNGLRKSKPTVNMSNSSKMTNPEQPALHSLIRALKTSTEEYLRKNVTNITLTYPGFFNSTQKLLIRHALEKASIQSVACSGTESSANAAVIAQ